jgi:hypothetical protein
MRRIAAVFVLLAAAMVAASSPAEAHRTITTKVVKTGLPTGVKVVQVNCDEPVPQVVGTTTTHFSHVFGQEFPPLGHGSLRVDSAASQVPQKITGLLLTSSGALSNVTALSARLDSEIGRLYAHVFPTGSDWVLTKDSQSFEGGWGTGQNHVLTGTGWTWTNGGIAEGPGTLADFVAAHPPSSNGFKVELLSGNCAVISTIPSYWDDLEFGLNGNTTKYDFEATSGGLTITASHSTIAAGGSVKLSTLFTDGGVPARGRNVELWAKKQGATHFTRIKMLTTNLTTGRASATVKPTKTTTYYWHHALDASIQATSSPKKTVTVTH